MLEASEIKALEQQIPFEPHRTFSIELAEAVERDIPSAQSVSYLELQSGMHRLRNVVVIVDGDDQVVTTAKKTVTTLSGTYSRGKGVNSMNKLSTHAFTNEEFDRYLQEHSLKQVQRAPIWARQEINQFPTSSA